MLFHIHITTIVIYNCSTGCHGKSVHLMKWSPETLSSLSCGDNVCLSHDQLILIFCTCSPNIAVGYFPCLIFECCIEIADIWLLHVCMPGCQHWLRWHDYSAYTAPLIIVEWVQWLIQSTALPIPESPGTASLLGENTCLSVTRWWSAVSFCSVHWHGKEGESCQWLYPMVNASMDCISSTVVLICRYDWLGLYVYTCVLACLHGFAIHLVCCSAWMGQLSDIIV